MRNNVYSLMLSLVTLLPVSLAAGVTSGSDGSDGILDIAGGQGTIVVSKGGLDADDDGIYHFTTINIGAGTTARFTKAEFGPRALIFLATGDVTISGILDINGENGKTIAQNPGRIPTPAGPGGFDGGVSAISGSGTSATDGEGPGGGKATPADNTAGSGGHATAGTRGNDPDAGGAAYGNILQQPIIGGSGSGGRTGSLTSGDGSGGGGAILLASSGTVTVDGAIQANGGSAAGCGASGGGIRIVATRIEGDGSLTATGGGSAFGTTSKGRIRLEADEDVFAGTLDPAATRTFVRPILYPENGPEIRLVSVDGVNVAEDPTGSFAMPDVTIDNGGEVTLALEASNIPVGTVINLRLVGGEGADLDIVSTPLAGTLESSTATATATIPTGFSRFYMTASW